MKKIRELILNSGQKSEARIVLPENEDQRVKDAIIVLKDLGFNILNIDDFNNQKVKYLDYINSLSFTKNWPLDKLNDYLQNPMNFGLAMVACGDADCLVAGAKTASSEVIRSAIRIIGIKSDVSCVSSIFFMVSPNEDLAFSFADCAVIPEPDSNQLVDIAYESSKFHELLTSEKPIIAFLSFSTKGSSSHYRVDKVKKAVDAFGVKYPNILHDGEIQFDAAICPEINELKISNSPIRSGANVFIFPNLDAGNIAYKITQRLAGYSAWGPLLQGLKKPVHDLSRGCSVKDIVNVSAISAMQSDVYANI
tara:strand:- start:31 stop:954 length:924 start_codon:yes stop_codon:yes gene_type:complete